MAFVPRFCMACGVAFTDMRHFFGGRSCYVALIAKFWFSEGGVSRSRGSGCWMGDAAFEPGGK